MWSPNVRPDFLEEGDVDGMAERTLLLAENPELAARFGKKLVTGSVPSFQ